MTQGYTSQGWHLISQLSHSPAHSSFVHGMIIVPSFYRPEKMEAFCRVNSPDRGVLELRGLGDLESEDISSSRLSFTIRCELGIAPQVILPHAPELPASA